LTFGAWLSPTRVPYTGPVHTEDVPPAGFDEVVVLLEVAVRDVVDVDLPPPHAATSDPSKITLTSVAALMTDRRRGGLEAIQLDITIADRSPGAGLWHPRIPRTATSRELPTGSAKTRLSPALIAVIRSAERRLSPSKPRRTPHGAVHRRMPIRPSCQTARASSAGTRTHPCDAGYAGT